MECREFYSPFATAATATAVVAAAAGEVRERQSHKCVDGYDDVDVEGKKKPRRTKYLYPYIQYTYINMNIAL